MYGEALCKAPFGYRNVNKADSHNYRLPLHRRQYATMEIVEDQAVVIREAYNLYATGNYGIRDTHKILSEKYKFTMSSSNFHLILTNQFYAGVMKIKGKEYKHCYETIIDEKLFFKVQAIIQSSSYKKTLKSVFFYRGLIMCGECNGNLTGINSTKKKSNGSGYIYYKCTESNGKHEAKYFREELFTNQIACELAILKNSFLMSPFKSKMKHITKLLEDIYCKFNKDPKSSLPILQAIFNRIELTKSSLKFSYTRLFDLMVHEPDYFGYKIQKNDLLYLVNVKEQIEQILSCGDAAVKKPTLITSTSDILNILEKPMHINDILSKLGGSLESIQQQLIEFELNAEVEEVSPGVWQRT